MSCTSAWSRAITASRTIFSLSPRRCRWKRATRRIRKQRIFCCTRARASLRLRVCTHGCRRSISKTRSTWCCSCRSCAAICRPASMMLGAPHIDLEAETDLPPLPAKSASAIGGLVSELVTNAVKHWQEPGETSTVRVRLKRDALGGGSRWPTADRGSANLHLAKSTMALAFNCCRRWRINCVARWSSIRFRRARRCPFCSRRIPPHAGPSLKIAQRSQVLRAPAGRSRSDPVRRSLRPRRSPGIARRLRLKWRWRRVPRSAR